MELRHLRYFLAVAEELNFSRAAARLHMAQPPLSRQIRDLEAELGTLLVRRQGSVNALTPAGQVFLEHSVDILDRCATAVRTARAVGEGKAGTMTMGYIPSAFCYPLLVNLIRSFQTQFPEIHLKMKQLSPVLQMELLQSGRLDLAVVHSYTAQESLAHETIWEEPLDFIFPERHRLLAKTPLKMRDMVGEPFIMISREWCPAFYSRVIQGWRDKGFEPKIVQESESYATTLALVASGLGISFSSPTLRKGTSARVKAKRVTDFSMKIGIDLIWRSADRSAGVHSFVSMLRAHRLEMR